MPLRRTKWSAPNLHAGREKRRITSSTAAGSVAYGFSRRRAGGLLVGVAGWPYGQWSLATRLLVVGPRHHCQTQIRREGRRGARLKPGPQKNRD